MLASAFLEHLMTRSKPWHGAKFSQRTLRSGYRRAVSRPDDPASGRADPLNITYRQGTTTSVSSAALRTPPMIARASGTFDSAPGPPRAIGVNASTVVRDVIRMGRSRIAVASLIASVGGRPSGQFAVCEIDKKNTVGYH